MKIKILMMVFVFMSTFFTYSNAEQVSLGNNTNLIESTSVYDVASFSSNTVLVNYRAKAYSEYLISLKTYSFAEYSQVFGTLLSPQDSFLSISLSHHLGEAVIELQLPDEYDNALIDVYGDFLFVYAGNGLLKIYDLASLPSKLEEVRKWNDSGFVDNIQINNRLNNLNIRGKYLYASGTGKIIIYDISNLSNLVKVAELEFSNKIRILNVTGDRAYAISVKNEKYYLTVYKIKDGIVFEELGETKLGGKSVTDIDILNGYVYLCDDNLTIFDTADPKNIKKVYSSNDFVLGKNPTVTEFELLSDKKHAIVRSIEYGYKVNLTIISVDDFTNIKSLVSNDVLTYSNGTYDKFLFVDFTTFKTEAFISALQVYGCVPTVHSGGCEEGSPVLPIYFMYPFENIELTSTPTTELSTLIPRVKNKKLKLKWHTLYENGVQKYYLIRKKAVSRGTSAQQESDKIRYRRDMRRKINRRGKEGRGAAYRFVDRHLKHGAKYRYLLEYKNEGGKKHLLRKFDITVPRKK